MRCIIKTLLLALLMVAIPMQGFAAITMRPCEAHLTVPAHIKDAGTPDASDCDHHHAGGGEQDVKQKNTLDAQGKCGGSCCALGALTVMALPAALAHSTHPEQSLFRSAFFYRLTLPPLQRPPLYPAA